MKLVGSCSHSRGEQSSFKKALHTYFSLSPRFLSGIVPLEVIQQHARKCNRTRQRTQFVLCVFEVLGLDEGFGQEVNLLCMSATLPLSIRTSTNTHTQSTPPLPHVTEVLTSPLKDKPLRALDSGEATLLAMRCVHHDNDG